MENSCTRCHRGLTEDGSYCPGCGLPRLTYSGDDLGVPLQPEPWDESVPDAATVNWRVALRATILAAVPAGLLSSSLCPLEGLGMVWMLSASICAVVLYAQRGRPAWITLGAGVRIGLVTGLLASWLAFSVSGGALFFQRFVLHQSTRMDAEFNQLFVQTMEQRMQQSISEMGQADAQQMQTIVNGMLTWLRSPEGHAGMWTGSLAFSSLFLLLFAMGGGAMGARMVARRSRSNS